MNYWRACFALIVAGLTLSGCGLQPRFVAVEEPWRADDERASPPPCRDVGVVRESNSIRARPALGGPSVCGAIKPFTVSATANGWVQLKPAALLRCPMIPAVDYWVQRVVMPAARHYLGQQVVELKV